MAKTLDGCGPATTWLLTVSDKRNHPPWPLMVNVVLPTVTESQTQAGETPFGLLLPILTIGRNVVPPSCACTIAGTSTIPDKAMSPIRMKIYSKRFGTRNSPFCA